MQCVNNHLILLILLTLQCPAFSQLYADMQALDSRHRAHKYNAYLFLFIALQHQYVHKKIELSVDTLNHSIT